MSAPCSLPRGHACAHLSPGSPGAFGLVSCWLPAEHPPWHPACPSGQQPGSVHLGGAAGGGGGGIQSPLREERRGSGTGTPIGGLSLPQGADDKGCPLPCPSVPGVLGAVPATWQPDPFWLQVQFPEGVSVSLPAEPQKNTRCAHSKPGTGHLGQPVSNAASPLVSRPLPGPLLSLGSTHISRCSGPHLEPRTLLLQAPPAGPSRTLPNALTWAGQESGGSSTPLPPGAAGGVSRDPNTWLRGELRPALATGEAQPVIGMSHPLARQPWGGGGREKEREREGGKEGRGAGGKPQATSGVGLGPGARPPPPPGPPI